MFVSLDLQGFVPVGGSVVSESFALGMLILGGTPTDESIFNCASYWIAAGLSAECGG